MTAYDDTNEATYLDAVEWLGSEPPNAGEMAATIEQTKRRFGVEAQIRFSHRRGQVLRVRVDSIRPESLTTSEFERELRHAFERAGLWGTRDTCDECGRELQPWDNHSGRILRCTNPECPIHKTAYRAPSYQLERGGHRLMLNADSPLAAATVAELEGELERRVEALAIRSGERLAVLYFRAGHAIPERIGELHVESGRVSFAAQRHGASDEAQRQARARGQVRGQVAQNDSGKLLERVYVEGADAKPGIPADGVPPLMKKAVPLHEVIKVDVHVPGCPPKPNAILLVLSELLEGRKPDLGSKLRFG